MILLEKKANFCYKVIKYFISYSRLYYYIKLYFEIIIYLQIAKGIPLNLDCNKPRLYLL